MKSSLPPDEIVKRIEKALDRDGTHAWSDMVELLKAGKCQMFWNDHGAWITEIIQFPRAKHLHCWVVAGELPGVMDIQKQVEKYSKAMNCNRITATARTGWKHVAREYGWKESAMSIVKEVA